MLAWERKKKMKRQLYMTIRSPGIGVAEIVAYLTVPCTSLSLKSENHKAARELYHQVLRDIFAGPFNRDE